MSIDVWANTKIDATFIFCFFVFYFFFSFADNSFYFFLLLHHYKVLEIGRSMALLLLPTMLAGNLLRINGRSLAVSAGRQLSFFFSHNVQLKLAPSPLFRSMQRKSTTMNFLQQSSPGFGSSLLHTRRFSTYIQTTNKGVSSVSHLCRRPHLLPFQSRLQSASRSITTIASQLESEGQAPRPTRRIVAYHLFICAAMVYLIIVVGGLTRLTESGLSITEWNPGFKGMKLPWTDAEWEKEWQKYRGTPEWAL